MAPKGKKGKKAGDDWDEGLGESAEPIAQADADAKAADAAADAEEEESGGGGGLMAALKKNKERRKKKGKNVDLDELEGEGDTVTPTVDESLDLAAKAPEEATMDDEDAFGAPQKKGKGGKGGKQQPAKEAEGGDEEAGGVKTKAQKEKEKKEREKQRKKENVCLMHNFSITRSNHLLICMLRLLSRRNQLRLPHPPRRRRTMPKPLKLPLQLLRPHLKLLEARRRSCQLVSQRSRSSKRSLKSAKKKTSDSGKRRRLALKKRRD